jgi:hypothetical protein
MNKDQELTPKYWVGHDVESDDVFLNTASKSKCEAETKMNERFRGTNWRNLDYISIDLMEIKLVNFKD